MLRADLIADNDPLAPFKTASSTAIQKLVSILSTRTIYPSPMPFLPSSPRAVCFTECIWDALTSLSERYSSYGIVFNKRLVFQQGGGPSIYLRGDILNALGTSIPPSLEPFVNPFDPTAVIRAGVPYDWLHEREWRMPGQFRFEYHQIEHVIVNSIDDAKNIVHQIGAQFLPEEKLIPMEVYQAIREDW